MAQFLLFQKLVTAFCCLSLISLIALNANLGHGLYYLGVDAIYELQSNPSALMQLIMNMTSMLLFVGFGALGMVFLLDQRKMRSLVYLTYVIMHAYMMYLIKQIFQQYRPYWINDKIHRLDFLCLLDFGDFSGHSSLSIVLFQPIFADYLGMGRRKFVFPLLIVMELLIMFSRMYLGSHSLNQVIFGLGMGLSFVVLFHFYLQEALYNLYTNILMKKSTIMYAIITTISLITCMIPPVIVFKINSQNRPISSDVLSRVNSCNSVESTGLDLQASAFLSASVPFILFGILYGELIHKNQKDPHFNFYQGKWSYTSRRSQVFYILAILLLAGLPILVFYVLIPHKLVTNPYANYFIALFGLVLAGFCVTQVLSRVCDKFQWITYKLESNEDEKEIVL